MFARILPPIAVAALMALISAPVGAQIVPTPRAAELPVTATSRPFLAAGAAAQPTDLGPRGYAESEFLVNGAAAVYDWDATGAKTVARGAPVPYATRLLVRRPVDARRFSGLVVLELLNPTELHDTAPVWSLARDELLRAGHAWVGLTVKPAALAALQRFDAARYAKVGFAYSQPVDCRPVLLTPGVPGSDGDALASPRAENGLAWDAISQAGALLRSGSRENPLRDLEPRRIVAAGFGESANYLLTFVNASHARLRLGDGSPVFDAYVQIGGGLADVPLNQCAPPLPAEDPRRHVGRRDVPFFSVQTQTEVARAAFLRRADSDDPADAYRLFEVAGSALSDTGDAGRPGTRELELLGLSAPAETACEEPAGDFPLSLAVGGVVLQIQQLLFNGTAPPRAPLISLDSGGQLARDAAGNALGGLRLPQLQVPAASYAERSTPRRADDAANVWRCSLTGTARRFDSAEMKRLYGTRAEYLRRFNGAVDQAVTERFITAADGAALKTGLARTAPAF
jgi:hypothetical protein